MDWLKLPKLPTRRPDAHKGDFGRALLIGGSRGMAGAVALAGMACLKSGAGLTTLAVPDPILDVVATFDPCYMTIALPADSHGRLALAAGNRLEELWPKFTCAAIGPGLGQSDNLAELLRDLYREAPIPLVVDADALNLLARDKSWSSRKAAGPRVLTPHPGEFRRLLGDTAMPDERLEQERLAGEIAARSGAVVLLKGAGTLVTDGRRAFRNATGNPGMATGGSGDVLTGVIAALLAQGLAPLEAASLGAHVHGHAGDLAIVETSQVSLTARDLLGFLPQAMRAVVA